MHIKTSPSPLLVKLIEQYQCALQVYNLAEAEVLNINDHMNEQLISALEEKAIYLGLELEKIENSIIEFESVKSEDKLPYLQTVVDILARREDLANNHLVISLKNCLHTN